MTRTLRFSRSSTALFSALLLAASMASRLAGAPEPLRFGIVTQNISVTSPADILIAIEPLTTYLEEKIGRPIQSRVFEEHQQVITLLKKGRLDFGYVSDWEYIRVKDAIPDIEPLARPRKSHKDRLDVMMVTRAEDGIKDMYQLKGTRIACHNTFSTASYLYPSILVSRVGYRGVESFFSRVIKTKKQANGIYAVAFHKADVTFVDDHVFDLVCELKPKMKSKVKVRRLQDEGYPPVVFGPIFVRRRLAPDLKDTIRRELIAMNMGDMKARQILLLFRIAGFVKASDGDYEPLRKLVREYDARKDKAR